MLSLTITLVTTAFVATAASPERKPRTMLLSIGTAAVYAPKPDRPACPGANRAINFYRHAYQATLKRIGRVELPPRRWWGCNSARRRAVDWRTKARQARQRVEAYVAHMHDWRAWLPDKFARVGACETGYGRRPGNWDWDSGTYVSAFGIIRGAYDQFSHRLGYPGWDEGGRTPRQQYEVAAAIQAAYGWSAWGCGGA